MIIISFTRPVPSQENDGTMRNVIRHNAFLDIDLGFYIRHYKDCIESVAISGDDLHHILHTFNNIPMNVKTEENIYRGEIAIFILENWG